MNQMHKGRVFAAVVAVLAAANAFGATVLPKPAYANSIVISLEHLPSDAGELAYIKANFPFGLYAWPSVSVTHVDPALAWISNWSAADTGIAAFKTKIDAYIAAANAAGFKLHLVLCSGLARGIGIYAEAKTEDIRNAQWFNDNNLGTAEQMASSEAMTKYVFGTFSRYARKLRANLEAKSRAAFAFLKGRMDDHPETLILASGWGEAELSDSRINYANTFNSKIGDYSPFAVLEFRDWITHQGMYDDTNGKFKGQGWAKGGAAYQGDAGRTKFNDEFGTAFTTWDLKYFNWSLNDDWDQIPSNGVNNDPGRIPLSSYVQGGMMPGSSQPGFIAGGFDPPRTINPGGKFWDLWNLFRESMVHHLILDTAGWVREAGIAADRWFSHQIPADYLFGTKPGSGSMNARYHTSASPLWTAGIAPLGSTGASIYDVKYPPDHPVFPDKVSRTTDNVFPAISAMSDDWAILEYDAESYATPNTVQSSPDFILAQFLRTYSYRPHLINFWRWMDERKHQIKGMNKETALREFIRRIRDKARATNMETVYAPPQVTGLSGSYGAVGGAAASLSSAAPSGLACAARLKLTGRIWPDADWTWTDWGDFDHFEIYRGTSAKYAADKAHLLGTTTAFVYDDTTAVYGGVYYYVWRAVNSAGVKGALSAPVMVAATVTTGPLLALSRTALLFGRSAAGGTTPAQTVVVTNAGSAGTTIHWTAVSNAAWLAVAPASGTGAGRLSISIKGTGLAAGKYTGTVTVDDPQAANGPMQISVILKVMAANKNAAPVGKISTPENKAVVDSCIAVAGWALDDIAVNKVVIKRFPAASDPDEIIDDDGWVTLGQAALIRGARPDIEKKYAKKYPRADRAGWGYTLVTNLLPNNGNGTFKIAAVASDLAGRTKRLGTRTIFVNNAEAKSPFGSIDTPAMGETASGGAYAQTGWALTPPSYAIPNDGSTIAVLLDGAVIGRPQYNIAREDIAALFPGYANSAGPGGSFVLDTTTLANTTHTIAWRVKDNNPDTTENTRFIGFRYFDVLNVGSSTASIRSADLEGGYSEAVRLPEVTGAALTIEPRGEAKTVIGELGAADLSFAVPAGARLIGWGADPTKPLPVGSTLDPLGRFRWLAGPGFLGRHVLHFAATDGLGRGPAVEVVVDIVPKSGRLTAGD